VGFVEIGIEVGDTLVVKVTVTRNQIDVRDRDREPDAHQARVLAHDVQKAIGHVERPLDAPTHAERFVGEARRARHIDRLRACDSDADSVDDGVAGCVVDAYLAAARRNQRTAGRERER
jgi:hypothetical protein